MVKRKKIILPFLTNYNASTGIVIYLANIVRHFNALPDQLKPSLVLIYNQESPIEVIVEIKYPYISFVNESRKAFLGKRVINKISRSFFNTEFFPARIHGDYVFPAFESGLFASRVKRIFWKEDFQESYYPELFRESELNFVENFFKVLTANPKNALVLSSHSAGNDLRKFYGWVKNDITYLRFVSILPDLNDSEMQMLRQRFGLEGAYFIVSNQFWPHKNHLTVLKALNALPSSLKSKVKVVFTGKTSSVRNPHYFDEIMKQVASYGLNDNIVVTGFMERSEQLLLMKHALAVIQPSLFEGWSTVIEDAKALGQYVLAADLDVNREQLIANATFFSPLDFKSLASLMERLWVEPTNRVSTDYDGDIQRFRDCLVSLFSLDEQLG